MYVNQNVKKLVPILNDILVGSNAAGRSEHTIKFCQTINCYHWIKCDANSNTHMTGSNLYSVENW